jgi:hypothetical protein
MIILDQQGCRSIADARALQNNVPSPRQSGSFHRRRPGSKIRKSVKKFECDTENLRPAAANHQRPCLWTTQQTLKIYESPRRRFQLVGQVCDQLDNAINKGTEFQGYVERTCTVTYGSCNETRRLADLRKTVQVRGPRA